MIRNIIIATLILSIALASCNETIDGDGNVISNTINISENCEGVKNNTDFNITVVFSNENKVEITAESNIAEKLETKIDVFDNNKLEISSGYKFNNTKPVSIIVYMKPKNNMYFTNSGAGYMAIEAPVSMNIEYENTDEGDIFAYESEQQNVSIKNNNSGNVEVVGITRNVTITGKGSGTVNCYSLTAQHAEIHSSGRGRINAYATDNAEAWISGLGEVYIYGTENVIYHNGTE